MARSSIDWTGFTWNPVGGCKEISPGCGGCYAKRTALRLQRMGMAKYANGFDVVTHDYVLEEPLRRKKPTVFFVCSMSDLFHKDVPLKFIQRVFEVMNSCPQHAFQVLTKRSERLEKVAGSLTWTDNIWAGVTVENADYLWRIQNLLKVPTKTRFLSLEPLLGPLTKLELHNIDWVIVGGESGPKSRPMQKEWVREIRDNCIQSQVPFFFKQWGGRNKKQAGKLLDGRTWTEMPEWLS